MAPDRGPFEVDRYGFVCSEVPIDLRQLYVGNRTPHELRSKGTSNLIKYNW